MFVSCASVFQKCGHANLNFGNLYLVRGGKGGALIEKEGLADKLLRLVFGEGTIGIYLIMIKNKMALFSQFK